ncbi:MAG: tetratricopeptide repeat protein, partial [Bacteroidetes bacterium]|nr:tetratricopeptide repeat protein [Bacteroidota bacterium]
MDTCINKLENSTNFKIEEHRELYAELLYQKASLFGERGDYNIAIELLDQVIIIRTEINGPNDTLMAKLLNNIGTNYYYLGDLMKANQYYESALELAMLSKNQQGDIAAYSENIGIIYARMGDFEKALEYLSRSLKMSREILNEDDPDIGQIYSNLGALYAMLGLLDEAINYYDLAESIHIKAFGNESVSLAGVYFNKGSIYLEMADPEEAERFFKNALNIYNKILNPDHPNIARINNNLGSVYLAKKDYDQAKVFFQRGLDTQNDPSSQSILLRNMATVYAKTKDFVKANEYFHLSIEKVKNEFGSTHFQYGYALQKYSEFLLNQNQLELAKKNIALALEVQNLNFDAKNSDASYIYTLYGDYYYKSEDYLNALKNYQKSLIANDYNFFDKN